MNYYISDLHIGHTNALAFDARPFKTIEENDETIKNNWNSVVGLDDDVYLLGDISWYGSTKTLEYYSQLNGRIHLIKGNHDNKILKNKDLQNLFVEIVDYKELYLNPKESIILCHYPIPCFKNHYYGWYHLYGHVHTGFENNMMQRTKYEMENLYNTPCKMYNVGAMLLNYTPIVKEYMDKHGLKDDSELPDYFVTAQTLDYKNRIYMQSIWQSHIDASISSTVNVPNDFTVEQVEGLYMTAWDAGLKGVTIFRDGCKRAGILTIKENVEDIVEKPHRLERGMIIKADDNCIGKKRTLRTGCGTLHCEAFFDPDNGQLLETYFSKGSSGGCNNFMIGLSRMISLAARGGIDVYSIVDQLKSSGTCPSYAVRTATKHDTSKGSSCPVAIGNALLEMYEEMMDEVGFSDVEEKELEVITPKIVPVSKAKCPQCGGELVFEGGCNTCKNCGWSKCD